MKSTIFPLMLCFALATPAVLAGEPIYRSTMPDGSTRYGEEPAPGAKSVKKVPAPPATTGVTVVTPEEKGRGAPPVRGGGVAVIPQPVRPPLQAAEQGRLHGPGTDLPKRSY